MVILGGLEIAAVGYLLNEFNKDKIEERERRKNSNQRPDHDHPHNDRPHSRPHSNSRPPPPAPYPPQASNHNLLIPPQAPMRPMSAPPQDPRPEWQRQQQQQGFPPQGQYQPQQMQRPQNGPQQRPPQGPSHELPGNDYPFQTQLWHKQQTQQAQQQRPPQPPNQGPPPNQNLWQPGPQPGPQGPNQFTNQQPMNGPPPQQQYNNGPPPPGPGHLQRPQTQPPLQYQQGPPPPQQQTYLPQSNTFPIQPQTQQFRPQTTAPTANPPPAGPLVYINTKTGKVSHNLYPADHPMHRSSMSNSNGASTSDFSLARSSTSTNLGVDDSNTDTQHMPREFWGDEKYMRTMAGDIHTGMMWSEKDEDDLAYGKDYGGERERRKGRRRAGSGWREGSYERVRTDRGRGEEWA